jgi:two-component SAPR family response regulator
VFEKYNIEAEYNEYSKILNALINNRKSLSLLKRIIDAKEGEYYTRVHMKWMERENHYIKTRNLEK